MKVGSKMYLMFINKMQNFGLAFFFFGITAYFAQLNTASTILMIVGAVLFGLSKVLNALNPVYDDYEWEKVYPELEDNEV